jgi:hypothetical protein
MVMKRDDWAGSKTRKPAVFGRGAFYSQCVSCDCDFNSFTGWNNVILAQNTMSEIMHFFVV